VIDGIGKSIEHDEVATHAERGSEQRSLLAEVGGQIRGPGVCLKGVVDERAIRVIISESLGYGLAEFLFFEIGQNRQLERRPAFVFCREFRVSFEAQNLGEHVISVDLGAGALHRSGPPSRRFEDGFDVDTSDFQFACVEREAGQREPGLPQIALQGGSF
jgi:hypothetical protein